MNTASRPAADRANLASVSGKGGERRAASLLHSTALVPAAVAMAAAGLLAMPQAAQAQAQQGGGAGGAPDGIALSAGGADSPTGPGGAGADTVFEGGGGGGAGTTGGAGGTAAGDSSARGPGGATPGAAGGAGLTHFFDGGAGGGGGAHGSVAVGLPGVAVAGGAGGAGGNWGGVVIAGAGGGGAGGWGAVVTGSRPSGTLSVNVSGGAGGAGGASPGAAGSGGSGGKGLFFTDPDGTGRVTITAAVTGGAGGAVGTGGGRATAGAGGVGIEGQNLFISLEGSGSVTGGLSGDGTTRAAAFNFTGGVSLLGLGGQSAITGGIVNNGVVLLISPNETYTLGNVISGTGELVKSGPNQLTLTGVNTYSGRTQISGGRLVVASDANLGAPGGDILFSGGISLGFTGTTTSGRNVTLSAPGTIDVATGEVVTLTGIISGRGGLTKDGFGTLVLTGANDYAGATAITRGTLQIGNGGTTGQLGAGSVSGLGTLAFNRSDNITVSNAITENVGVTNNGAGMVTLTGMAASGEVRANAGTLVLSGPAPIASNRALTLNGGNVTLGVAARFSNATHNGGTLDLGGNTLTLNGGGYDFQLGSITGTGTIVIRDSFTNFDIRNANATIGSGVTINSPSGLPVLLNVQVAGDYTLAATLTGATLRTNFQNPGFTTTVTGNNTYGLSSRVTAGTLAVGSDTALGTSALSMQANTVLASGGTGNRALANAISLDGTGITIANPNAGTTFTLSGVITGANGFTASGPGTLILSSNNGFGGGMQINGGTTGGPDAPVSVIARSSAALGPGTVTFASGHGSLLLDFNGVLSNSVSYPGTALSQTIAAASGRTVTLAGLYDWLGTDGTWRFGSATNNGVLVLAPFAVTSIGTGRDVFIDGGTLRLGNPGGAFFIGIASDRGGLTIAEQGTLDIAGNFVRLANTTGTGTIANSGAAAALSLGAGTTFGGTFDTGANGITLTGTLAGSNPLRKAGAGTLTLEAGLNTGGFTGGVILDQGTLALAGTIAASFGTIQTNGSVIDYADGTNSAAPIVLNSNDTQLQVLGAGSATQSGIISEIGGARPIEKIGSGTLVLTGANTYSGGTVISRGTLEVNADAALGAATGGVRMNGGTLNFGTGFTTGRDFTIADVFGFLNTPASTTITGRILGPGTLVKRGSGTLTLTGLNSHSATEIEGGTLQIGNGGTSRTLGTSTVLISQGTGLAFNRSDDVTVANTIIGAGTLTKLGAGVLTLSGENFYSGGTTIASGTLVLNQVDPGGVIRAAGMGPITLSNNTLLQSNVTGSLRTSILVDGGISATIGAAAGTTLTLAGDQFINVGGPSTTLTYGSATLTGTIVHATGPSSINAGTTWALAGGTFRLGNANAAQSLGLYQVAGIRVGTGTTAATLDINGFETTVFNLTGSSAGTITNLGSAAAVLRAGNTRDTAFAGTITDGTAALGLTKGFAGTLTLTGTNTYTGTTEISLGTLRIGNGGTTGTLGSGSVTNNAALVFNRSDDFTVGNQITGSGTLTKQGAGNLTLSAANSYDGATTVAQGTLTISNALALGTGAGGTTVADGATLAFAGDIDVAQEAIFLNGMGVGNMGALRGVSGNNGISLATVTLQSDARINSDAPLLSLNRIEGGGNDLTVGGTGTLIINNPVTNVASLTKDGTGVVTLFAANTITGPATVNAGRLDLAGGASLSDTALLTVNTPGQVRFSVSETIGALEGTGSVTILSGAQLQVGGANTSNVFSGQIGGAGSLAKIGTGTFTLSGANSFGAATVSGGTLTVQGGAALSDSSVVTVNGSGTLRLEAGETIGGLTGFGNVVLATSGPLVVNVSAQSGFSGIISQSGAIGSFTKRGEATLNLTNVNAFTGQTRVEGGRLDVTGFGTLASTDIAISAGAGLRTDGGALSPSAVISNGGTFTITGSETIGAISGAGGISLSGGGLTTGNAGDATISGVISGVGGLTKAGSGTLTLSGANNNAGVTSVQAGTLLVNGSTVSGVNVFGGTLGGTGTIGGNVFVSAGARLAPGQGAGTLAIAGNLELSTSSILDFELAQAGRVGGGINDLISVGGNLALDGVLNVTALTGFGAGYYRLINYSGTLSNGGLNIGVLPDGFNGTVLTDIDGQVNVRLDGGGGQIIQYWDGSDTTGALATVNGEGGAGTWLSDGTNWTSPTGFAVNGAWAGQVGVFAGAAGGVVNVAGTQAFQELRFETDGYTLGMMGPGSSLATTGGFSIVNVADGIATRFNTPISGTGGLTKTGTGTLTLSGANTYAGPTTVAAGTLELLSGGTIAGAVQNNATLTSAGTIAGPVTNAGTLTSTGILNGGLTNNAGATASLRGQVNGAVGNSGTITLTGETTGITALTQGSTGQLNLGGFSTTIGSIAGSGVIAGSGAERLFIGGDNASTRFDGAITGANVVVFKSGTGSLTLSGANTASFVNQSGALVLEAGGTLGSQVEVRGGSFVNQGSVTGNVINSGMLTSTGSIGTTLNNNAGATANVAGSIGGNINNSGILTVTGNLAGGGALNTLGTGRVTVDSGAAWTAVNGIEHNSTAADGIVINGAVTLNSGQTFRLGAGSSVRVGAGGTLNMSGTNVLSQILAANNSTFTNAGTVNAAVLATGTVVNDGTWNGFLVVGSTASLTNNGTWNTSGPGNVGANGRVTNNGTISGNAINVSGSRGEFINNAAGTVTVTQPGAVSIVNNGASLTNLGRWNGDISVATTAAATLSNGSGATIDGAVRIGAAGSLFSNGTIAGGLNNAGAANIDGVVDGGITNTGRLLVDGGETLSSLGDLSNAGTGVVIVERDATWNLTGSASNTSTSAEGLTIDGTLLLSGTLGNAAGAFVTVSDGGTLNAGGVTNAAGGTITVLAGGTVNDALANSGFVNNAGVYNADVANSGTGAEIQNQASGVWNGNLTANTAGAVIANLGTWNGTASNAADLRNSGGTWNGAITNLAGGVLTSSGTINGDVVNAEGASAFVSGVVDGDIANSGAFQQSGTLTGIDAFVQTATGSLVLEDFDLSLGSLAGAGTVDFESGLLTIGSNAADTGFAGVISGGGTLVKTGAGTLTLTGANTLTGVTRVEAGGIVVENGGSLAGGVLNNAGFVLDGGFVGGQFVNNGELASLGELRGGLVNNAGARAVLGGAVNGGITNAGEVVLEPGARGIGAVSQGAGGVFDLTRTDTAIGSLAGAGSVLLGARTLTIGGNDASTSFGGVISGSGGITKTGAGTLTLTAAQTFAGPTTISGGTLALASGAALGGAVVNNAGLVNAGTLLGVVGNAGTLRSTGLLLGGLVNAAGGSASLAGTLTGDVANTGAITLTGALTGIDDFVQEAGGTLDIGGFATTLGSLSGGGAVSLGAGTLTVGANNADTRFDGAIAGTGALTKTGSGVLVLGGANTFTGLATVGAGTLTLASGGSLAGAVTNAANFGNAGTVAGLVTNNAALTSTGTLAGGLVNAARATATLSGTIIGPVVNSGEVLIGGNLTHTGETTNSAAFTVAGGAFTTGGGTFANTGTLTVNSGATMVLGTAALLRSSGAAALVDVGGTLRGRIDVAGGGLIGRAGSLIAGDVLIAQGATFMSGGTVTGNLTVNGTLMPGNSPGTLTVNGALALGASSTSVFEMSNAASDQIVVNGTATIASGATLVLTGARGIVPGQGFSLISASGGITGAFTNIVKDPAVLGFIRQSGNAIELLGTLLLPAGISAQDAATVNYLNQRLLAGTVTSAGLSLTPALAGQGGTTVVPSDPSLTPPIAAQDGTAALPVITRLSPEPYASAATMALENGLVLAKAVRTAVAIGAGADTAGFFTFGQGFAAGRDIAARPSGAAAAGQTGEGFFGGVGFGTASVGVSAFAGRSFVRQRIAALGAESHGEGTFFGGRVQLALGGLRISGSAIFDRSDGETSRSPITGPARGNYTLRGETYDAELAYELPVGSGLQLRPSAGVTHGRVTRGAVTENSGGAAALSVVRQSYDATWVNGEIALRADADKALRPWLGVGVRHLADGDPVTATGALAGFGGAFTVDGARTRRTFAHVNGGVGAELAPGLTAFVSGEIDVDRSGGARQVEGGLRLAF